MRPSTLVLLAAILLGTAAPAAAQDGLKLPQRPAASGIDPSLAQGWLALDRDRLGLAPNNWRDAIGFAPAARVQWSYPLGAHSVGMSMASGREYESAPIFGTEVRQYGLVGRYALTPDWSLNAESLSREPGAVFRLQDFRIGLRRQF